MLLEENTDEVLNVGRSPECGKRPLSGRNYILTVYTIIERV